MLKTNAMDLAEIGFKNALLYEPSDKTARQALNLIFFGKGETPPYPEISTRPSIEDFIKLGEASRDTLDLEKAAYFYRKGTELYPDNFDLQLGLSVALEHRAFNLQRILHL